MPLVAVKVTVVPALATPLVTVVPLIFSVGAGPKTVPVQLTACQMNPVLVPVSTILTVLPDIVGDAGKVIKPEAADVGVAVAFTAISRAPGSFRHHVWIETRVELLSRAAVRPPA